jgi:hypothetical protein
MGFQVVFTGYQPVFITFSPAENDPFAGSLAFDPVGNRLSLNSSLPGINPGNPDVLRERA